jgi:hypothetical protein
MSRRSGACGRGRPEFPTAAVCCPTMPATGIKGFATTMKGRNEQQKGVNERRESSSRVAVSASRTHRKTGVGDQAQFLAACGMASAPSKPPQRRHGVSGDSTISAMRRSSSHHVMCTMLLTVLSRTLVLYSVGSKHIA